MHLQHILPARPQKLVGEYFLYFSSWEVLNGVGVDGVGGIFPFFSFFFVSLRFYSFFVVFLRFSSFFLVFLRFSSFFFVFLLGQGQTTAIYWENGEFHSDPRLHRPRSELPEAGKFGGKFCGNFTGIFWTRQIKAQNNRGTFRSIFLGCTLTGV